MYLIKISEHIFGNIEAVLQVAQKLGGVGSVVDVPEDLPPVLAGQETEDDVIALDVGLQVLQVDRGVEVVGMLRRSTQYVYEVFPVGEKKT